MGGAGWVVRLSWTGNMVARRRETWKEKKLEEERCTNTMFVEIVINNK